MLDGVFEAGRGHGKVNGLLCVIAAEHTVDQAAAKGIAAADAVDNVHMVCGGEVRLVCRGFIEHTGPVVVVGRNGAAQGDGDVFAAKPGGKLPCHADVAVAVELAAVNIRALGFNAEHVLGVFFVGDAHVDIGQQLAHDLACALARPELFAEVEIAGNGQTARLGRLAGVQTNFGQFAAERRGDAGPVEPVCTVKDGIPVKIGALCQRDGRAGAVIDDLGCALRRALFAEVNAKPVAAADHILRVDAIAAQLIDGALADLMGRDLCNIGGVQTVVCQRNGHVGLTAGVGRLEPVALHQTQITDGVQAHHDLTKGNDSFCHGNSPSVR